MAGVGNSHTHLTLSHLNFVNFFQKFSSFFNLKNLNFIKNK